LCSFRVSGLKFGWWAVDKWDMAKKSSVRQSDVTLEDLYLLCQSMENRLAAIEKRLAMTNHPDRSIPDQLELVRSGIMDQLKLYAKIQSQR